MEKITEAAFRSLVKTGLGEGYLFYGDEDYLKAHAVSLAREALCPDPSFELFNVIKLDVLDFSPEKLVDTMMPPPMMAEKKLIVVTGLDFTAMRQGELDEICSALAMLSEYDYNTVIISVQSGGIDPGYAGKPSQVFSKLSAHLVPVCFERVSPERLVSWCARHFEHGGVKITRRALEFFVSYCGGSMFRLANEIEKLCAYVLYAERVEVTEADIREVSVPDTEFDVFALSNAIIDGRAADALAVLEYMRFKRTDPIVILGEISRTLCDLLMIKRLTSDGLSTADIAKAKYVKGEYQAKIYARGASKISFEDLHRKIKLCAEADRSIKNGYSKDYSPLERLICSSVF